MKEFNDINDLLDTLRPILKKGKINKFYIRRPKSEPLEIRIRFKIHMPNFASIQEEIFLLHRPNVELSIDLSNEIITIIFRRVPSSNLL